MAQASYTAIELLQMGRENYEKLVKYCTNLEAEGFWEQARQVMKQSSTEVLDRYVQSVLMTLAVHCGELLENQKEFIQLITDSNPLGISAGEDVEEQIIVECQRFTTFPPVLMQLCGVYDSQFHRNSAECFLDAFLNILLCMAYLNDGQDEEVNKFIRQYYEKIALFLNQAETYNHSEYLIRKLRKKRITCDIRWLHVDMQGRKTGKHRKESAKKGNGNKYPEISAGSVELQEAPGDGTWQQETRIKGESETERNGQSMVRKQTETEPLASEQTGEPTETVWEELTEPDESENLESLQQEADTKHVKSLEEIASEKALRVRNLRKEESEEDKRARELQEAEAAKEQFQLVKKRLQDREEAEIRAREARLQSLVDELNALVGLQGVKNEIQSLINLIRIRKLREQMQMPFMDMSYHMVFTGAPGTGKTTVARIVAKIYQELGILSKETVIETDRSGLVAGYVGQTALKVHELVEQAVGGVLFIDEAYALVNPDVPNDFGMEAVDTLVKLMEDHRDDLVIIVAGYTEEMKSFLKCNTGLVSRFNKFINFPDYSDQELLEILDVMASDAGLSIEQDARDAVGACLEKMSAGQKEEFGNARGIRNMFEKIVINQANRLIKQPHPTREMLMMILKEDIIFD